MIRYKTVAGISAPVLDDLVNRHIANGWTPIGGSTIYTHPMYGLTFTQAMVKPDDAHHEQSSRLVSFMYDSDDIVYDIAMRGPWHLSAHGGKCNYCGEECLGPDDEYYERGHHSECVYVKSRKLLESSGLNPHLYNVMRHAQGFND